MGVFPRPRAQQAGVLPASHRGEFDKHKRESDEQRQLQDDYRAEVTRDRDWRSFANKAELTELVPFPWATEAGLVPKMSLIRRIYMSMPADNWLTPAQNDLKWGIVERIEQLAILQRFLRTQRVGSPLLGPRPGRC